MRSVNVVSTVTAASPSANMGNGIHTVEANSSGRHVEATNNTSA